MPDTTYSPLRRHLQLYYVLYNESTFCVYLFFKHAKAQEEECYFKVPP